jgi:hypothetical protein
VFKVTERYRPERFDDPSIEQDSWTKALEHMRDYKKSRNR